MKYINLKINFCNDARWRSFSPEQKHILAATLAALACGIRDGSLPTASDVAHYAKRSVENAEETLEELHSAGIIEVIDLD
jgi:predicted transcriptional regulator